MEKQIEGIARIICKPTANKGNCELMEDFDSSKWEVIGNIHDNPELLTGGAV